MKLAPKIAVITSTVLLFFLLGTNPQHIPSAFLTVPFVLLFIAIASFTLFVSGALNITSQKIIKLDLVIATVPVLLLVLQSLGQLTVRDVLAVVVLSGIVYLYISRFGVQLSG